MSVPEHMLWVASDAVQTRHMLLALDQQPPAASAKLATPGLSLAAVPAAADGAAGANGPTSWPVSARGPDSADGEGADGADNLLTAAKSPFYSSPLGGAVSPSSSAATSPRPRRTTSGTEGSLNAAVAGMAPQHRRYVSCQAAVGGSEPSRSARLPRSHCRRLRPPPSPHTSFRPCRHAPYGRQMSVMFWRTFTDIGESKMRGLT